VSEQWSQNLPDQTLQVWSICRCRKWSDVGFFVPSRDDAVPANFVGKIEVGQFIHSIPLESAWDLGVRRKKESKWQGQRPGQTRSALHLLTDINTNSVAASGQWLATSAVDIAYPHKRHDIVAKSEPRIKRENNIGYILCRVHVLKWPVVKDKHIRIKPRIYVLFILCYTWTVNANSLKTKHYSYKKNMFLAATMVGWIGDSVYRKVAVKNIGLFL